MWDVAVVGAGPAGSAAALAALRQRLGARVLLLDREAFPRDKACGDGVAPQALDLLTELGVTGLAADLVPVRSLRLGFCGGPSVTGRMARPAYVIPRLDLDARLRNAAIAAGAVAREHRVRRVDVRPDRVELDGTIVAKTVIAADGAHSPVRRSLGIPANPPAHTAVALRGYAAVLARHGGEQVITFGDGAWPSYAWSFPIGDGRANVGYGEVLRAGVPLRRRHLLDRLDRLLPGAGADGVHWRAHHLPLSSARPRQPDGRVLLVGDALSLVNPLTGEGIYYAVLSGMLAGRAAADPTQSDPGASYRRALHRELGRHLRHTTALATMARSARLVRGAVRAAARDARVFDELVEVGLGRGLCTPRMLAGVTRQLARG